MGTEDKPISDFIREWLNQPDLKPTKVSKSSDALRKKNEQAKLQAEKYQKLHLADLHNTQIARYISAAIIFAILCWQNWFVFSMITSAIKTHQVKDIQIFLGVLLTATLLETYKLVHIIVTHIFKERVYKPDID